MSLRAPYGSCVYRFDMQFAFVALVFNYSSVLFCHLQPLSCVPRIIAALYPSSLSLTHPLITHSPFITSSMTDSPHHSLSSSHHSSSPHHSSSSPLTIIIVIIIVTHHLFSPHLTSSHLITSLSPHHISSPHSLSHPLTHLTSHHPISPCHSTPQTKAVITP